MRVAPLLVVLVACGPGTRDASSGIDAASPADAQPDDAAWFDLRTATGVIAGEHRVLWTQGHEPCSLEFGCLDLPAGPTLSMRDLGTGEISTLIEDAWGADSLVGDEDEVFTILVMGPNNDARNYVVRFRPGISTAPEPVSPPLDDRATLLFVDPTYVFWRLENSAKVYRASRTGDGSDATLIATGTFVPTVAFNGYYWAGSYRIPVAGGPVEQVLSIYRTYPIATADGIYATKAVDDSTYSLGVLGTDEVYRPVLASIPKMYVPDVLVVDGDELFWTSGAQTLHRANAGGSTISTALELQDVPALFAVTADEILYNFTRNGYDTAPR